MRLLATGEFGPVYREEGILRSPQEGVHAYHCLRDAVARNFVCERVCEGGGDRIDPRGIMNLQTAVDRFPSLATPHEH